MVLFCKYLLKEIPPELYKKRDNSTDASVTNNIMLKSPRDEDEFLTVMDENSLNMKKNSNIDSARSKRHSNTNSNELAEDETTRGKCRKWMHKYF